MIHDEAQQQKIERSKRKVAFFLLLIAVMFYVTIAFKIAYFGP